MNQTVVVSEADVCNLRGYECAKVETTTSNYAPPPLGGGGGV